MHGDVSEPRRAMPDGDGENPFYSTLAYGFEAPFGTPEVVEITKLYKEALQSERFSLEFRSQT